MSMLVARGLSIGFPGRLLVRDLDFSLQPGTCWAVLGNNGSGKSTLLHVLAGLRPPLAGEVKIDGQDCGKCRAPERARHLGLLLQEEVHEFWGTVSEYVLLGRYPHRGWLPGWSGADQAAAQAAMLRMELHSRASQMLSTCSGGERQRARLALVLAQDPSIYLLDEPLLHLDLRHQLQAMSCFRRLASESGKAVVMVLHDPSRARAFCDHALLLFDDGSSESGAAGELLRPAILERLYGCPVE